MKARIPNSTVRKTLIWLYKIALGVPVGLWVIIALSPWPKPRLATLWAFRQAGGCSLADAANSASHIGKMASIRDEIGEADRIIDQDGPLDLVQTSAERWWVNKNDRSLPFLLAEQSLQIYGAGDEGVQKGDIVLDCGANVGVFTKTALSRGARIVVAIEIAPTTIECLKRNFAPEISAGRVVVYPKGVWNKVDSMEMAEVDADNFGENSVVLGRELKNKTKVPMTTIDIIANDLQLPRVDFIKMDIEGAEKQALLGARHVIQRFHPRLAISCEHLPNDFRDMPELVSSIQSGYRVHANDCYDFGYRVRPEVLLFEY
ncbi:MAG TPA: FkbM family methyltransferase [Terriglobales bacterium]|nr:FkbM family methyltransferase [Terriglobales bacterium]